MRPILPYLLIVVADAVGLVYGWQAFWCLMDDAYINYRYVSNSVLGHGYVWNAAPFLPVEGYTSFLWVVLLDGIWRTTGVAPPDAANGATLVYSALTLGLVLWLALRMWLHAALAAWRLALVALVLTGTLANRSFLAWRSSGMGRSDTVSACDTRPTSTP